MNKREPFVIMPVVYWLPLVGLWRWCKLGEVCDLVPNVAMMAGNTYAPSMEYLVRDFAALVRHNNFPEGHADGKLIGKKMFRYSFGENVRATEVPNLGLMSTDPPYARFKLDDPLSREMFVPEGWVRDVIRAIRSGAIAAVQFRDSLMGIPRDNQRSFIQLGKARTTKG